MTAAGRLARTAAGATLLLLGLGAGLARESAGWTSRWIGPAGAGAADDLHRAGLAVRRWLRRAAVATGPLRARGSAAGRSLVETGMPFVAYQSAAAARALGRGSRQVAVAGARGGIRAGCRMRPVALAGARIAYRVLPRVAAVMVATGLLGWFGTGPTLRAAALLADVADPPFVPLAQRSTVVTADGSVLGTVHSGENRLVVPLERVPALARRLFTVAEDRSFFAHHGFDQGAMVRAAIANLRAGGVSQGASTITQQLVKQNFVGDDQTALRKLRELVLASAIESRTTKDELLARYLNQVYFGAGAYGIAAATETYFGTGVEQLRPEQAALLAALIRAPSTVDPWSAPAEATDLRNQVLAAAAEEGVLDPAAATELSGADLGMTGGPLGPTIQDGDAVAAVEREIAARPELGPDPAARVERFRSGGWTVETTIDPAAQEAARRAVAESLPSSGPQGAAIAVVEPGTGSVLALHSRRPAEMAHLELASMGRRQPGSTFKPLAAIVALEEGLSPDQPLEGRSGVTFDTGEEEWRVDNFGGRNHGHVDLAEALEDSVNTAFAQLGVAVGTSALVDVTARLGIDPAIALGGEAERGPAVALGGLRHGVTPLELANAYAAIANEGVYVEPTVIERITDADGREILSRSPDRHRAVDPVVNAQVRSMLEAVVDEGTGVVASLAGWRPFGKTGTSQDQADAWFVGAVPSIAAAVWVGDPLGRTPMPSATGGSVAAPVWQDFMSSVLEDRSPTEFGPPPPLRQRGELELPEPRPRGS